MHITRTVTVATRAEWRDWLRHHHADEPEIWLVCYRAGTDGPCLSYNDAVEEALCFGWIDSTVKTLDVQRYAQRYSPRRVGSAFSQTNKERLKRLIAQGLVCPDVLESLNDVDLDAFQWPDDIMEALRADPEAWAHWGTFSPAYRRIRVAYVETARDRGDAFQRRLDNLVRRTAQGKQFGRDIASYY